MRKLTIIFLFLFGCSEEEVKPIQSNPFARVESIGKHFVIMAGQSNCGYYTETTFGNKRVFGVKGWDFQDKLFVDSLTAYQMPGNKFSPLILIAEKMKIKFPNDELYFLQYHDGSTNLYTHWNVNNTRSDARFKILKANIDLALQNVTPDKITFIWVQGEADGAQQIMADAYYQNEVNLYDSITSLYNVDNFYTYLPYTTGTFINTVREAKINHASLNNEIIEIPIILSGTQRTIKPPHLTPIGLNILADSVVYKMQ